MGLKIKHHWLENRTKQLMSELHLDAGCHFCQGWFNRFKVRNRISLHRVTNVAQRCPNDLVDKIQFFLHSIQPAAAWGERIGALGQFQLSTIANVDQTPLPFWFNAGESYS